MIEAHEGSRGRAILGSQRRAGRKRVLARSVFGATVALLLAVAGLPLGLSLAQVEPQIQFLNPSAGTSAVVSDKQQAFHLTSWVNEVPQDPLVEYEFDITTTNTITGATEVETILLGEAVRSGNGFDLDWDLGDDVIDSVPEGPTTTTYTVRAILYAGYVGPGTGQSVSVDEQAITINHKDDPDPTQHSTEDAGESVQMTYPENGGPLGVYIRPNGSGGNFTIETIVSQHTRFLRPFYTKSKPGEEPVWRSCGIAGGRIRTVEGVRIGRIRCTIPAGDYALDVTGAAVVTNDTPAPTPAGQAQAVFNDGADAHVVVPYFQRAASVTIDPPTIGSVIDETGCPTLTATVLDQLSRPVGNMNVDVHLQGPSDQVRFGTVFPAPEGNNLNKPPDRGHASPETASSCLEGPKAGAGGKQGEHDVIGGLDIKHIETTSGTDLSGTFMFAVTAERRGGSQITAWADEDDDDSFCVDEKAGVASVGWEQGAPPPTALPPSSTGCSVSIPSPSPTPSASPSGPSPTATATEAPDSYARSVDIAFAHASLIVSGHVRAPEGGDMCSETVPVKVQRRQNKKFVTLRNIATDGHGRYSVSLRDRPGRYRAVATRVKRSGVVCERSFVVARHIH